MTDSALISIQEKYQLSYHIPYVLNCDQAINLSGKKVLEVGGCLPPELTIGLLGCSEWLALETADYDTELGEANQVHRFSIGSEFSDKFTHKFMNIEDLDGDHNNSYDVVFSIAAFEHIAHFPEALEKMYQVLKPGGFLFSMFSPIWSAHDGHHLPTVKTESGEEIGFGSSPIPPWGHLLFDRVEMREYLCRSIDLAAANEVIYYVYNSPHINRYFTEDYLYFVEQSPFTKVSADLTFPTHLPEDVDKLLKAKYPNNKMFSNNGLRLILQKRENSVDLSQTLFF